jgi:murein DD-endopeptidase MepM/ murein hydrolase activator NlpD
MKRERRPRRKKLLKKLKSKFRLTVLNESTFEERFSYSLTPMNVIVMFGGLLFVFGLIIYLLVAFTPLKVYLVPGYVDVEYREQAREARIAADSLNEVLAQNQAYFENVKTIISGGVVNQKVDTTQLVTRKLEWTKEDSLYDLEMKSKKPRKNFQVSETEFTMPVVGKVIDRNNYKNAHMGMDYAAAKGTPVMTIAEGRVISVLPLPSGTYQVMVQHADGWLSIYSNLQMVMVNQGQAVASQSVLGQVGYGWEKELGAHLHLEIWKSGLSVNPSIYF